MSKYNGILIPRNEKIYSKSKIIDINTLSQDEYICGINKFDVLNTIDSTFEYNLYLRGLSNYLRVMRPLDEKTKNDYILDFIEKYHKDQNSVISEDLVNQVCALMINDLKNKKVYAVYSSELTKIEKKASSVCHSIKEDIALKAIKGLQIKKENVSLIDDNALNYIADSYLNRDINRNFKYLDIFVEEINKEKNAKKRILL